MTRSLKYLKISISVLFFGATSVNVLVTFPPHQFSLNLLLSLFINRRPPSFFLITTSWYFIHYSHTFLATNSWKKIENNVEPRRLSCLSGELRPRTTHLPASRPQTGCVLWGRLQSKRGTAPPSGGGGQTAWRERRAGGTHHHRWTSRRNSWHSYSIYGSGNTYWLNEGCVFICKALECTCVPTVLQSKLNILNMRFIFWVKALWIALLLKYAT